VQSARFNLNAGFTGLDKKKNRSYVLMLKCKFWLFIFLSQPYLQNYFWTLPGYSYQHLLHTLGTAFSYASVFRNTKHPLSLSKGKKFSFEFNIEDQVTPLGLLPILKRFKENM
jgi:hypothetical protein